MISGFSRAKFWRIIGGSWVIVAVFQISIWAQDKPYVGGEVLIQTRKPIAQIANFQSAMQIQSVTGGEFAEIILNNASIQPASRADQASVYRVRVSSDADVNDLMTAVQNHPDVVSVQPNYIYRTQFVPNDPEYSVQQTNIELINLPTGWELADPSNPVLVGILDTGVDWDHVDLRDKIWENPGEIPNNRIDDDNNGFVDDIRGWDFVDEPNLLVPDGEDGVGVDNDPMDFDGHGTHVAGIAGAALDNGIGIAGTTRYAKIVPLRAGYREFSGRGAFSTAGIIAALDYAANNGIGIVNMSLGGAGPDPLLEAAIIDAQNNGVIIVAAAGNAGQNIDSVGFIPATYSGVVAVSRVSSDGEYHPESNFGPSLSFAAPGTQIYSTSFSPKTANDTYRFLDGTSMSSPFVAGAMALVLGVWPSADVVTAFQDSAFDFGEAGRDDLYGFGVINVAGAIGALDLEVPSMSHTSLSRGDPGLPLSIVAEITDDLQSSSALTGQVRYRTRTETGGASTEWVTVNMTSDGTTYTAIIPTLSVSVVELDYRILANDLNPTHTVTVPEDDTSSITIPITDETAPTVGVDFLDGDFVSVATPLALDVFDNTTADIQTLAIQLTDTAATYNLTLSHPAVTNIGDRVFIDWDQLDIVAGAATLSVQVSDIHSNTSTTQFLFSLSVVGETPPTLVESANDQPFLNVPNPFDPTRESTFLAFQLTADSEVSVGIYSLTGQVVMSQSLSLSAGYHEVEWDGQDESGQSVPNGVYLGVITFGDQRFRTKIAVLRQ